MRERLFVVLTASEWRNLCASGEVPLMTARPVWFLGDPDERALARCFAAAPSAKFGSRVEYLVLELRPNWPYGSRLHRHHTAVAYLATSDVLSHHALDEQARDYYAAQVQSIGIEVAERTFEAEWTRWSLEERRDQARIGGLRLAAAVDGTASATPADLDGWIGQIVDVGIGVLPRDGDETNEMARLKRLADSIVFDAADVRGYGAFYLAAAILWVSSIEGQDPREHELVGVELTSALAATEQVPWTLDSAVWGALAPAFASLSQAYPRAFGLAVRPATVGMFVRIMTECEGDSLEPDALAALLRQAFALDPLSGRLMCHFTAAVLAPDRLSQLIWVLNTKADASGLFAPQGRAMAPNAPQSNNDTV